MFGFFRRRKVAPVVAHKSGYPAYTGVRGPVTVSRTFTPTIAPTPPRDDSTDFVIGYATGIPMPSVSGLVGSMLHSSASTPARDPEPAPSRSEPESPSYTAPDTSSSYSSDSSSSSSDSSSSYSAPSDPGGQ